jgi:hypothetical protein
MWPNKVLCGSALSDKAQYELPSRSGKTEGYVSM